MQSNRPLDPASRKKAAKQAYNQGKTHYAKAEFSQAIECFEHACELDESYLISFETQYSLVLAYDLSQLTGGVTSIADLEKKLSCADVGIRIFVEQHRKEFKKIARLYAIKGEALHELLKQKDYSLDEKQKLYAEAISSCMSALNFGEEPGRCYKDFANIYSSQKKPHQVIEYLREALKHNPKDQEAKNLLYDFLLQWDNAPASHWDSASNLQLKTNIETIFSVIKLLPKENQFTLLCKFLHPLKDKRRLADALPADAGKRQEILNQMWEHLTEIDPNKERNPFKTKDAAYYYARGNRHIENKEYEKAIRDFEIGLMCPSHRFDFNLCCELAFAYLAQQDSLPIKERDYGKAQECLEYIKAHEANFMKLDDKSIEAKYFDLCSRIYYKIAFTNETKGTSLEENPVLYRKAWNASNELIKLKRNDAIVYVDRAYIFSGMNEPEMVLICLLTAYKFANSTYRQEVQRKLYEFLLKFDEITLNLVGTQQIFESIRLLPKDNQILLLRKCLYDFQSPLAKRFRKDNDNKVIKRIYDHLKKLDPSCASSNIFVIPPDASPAERERLSFDQYMQFGKAYSKEQKYEEAIQCFDLAISLDTQDGIQLSEAYYQRGLLRYEIKQFDDGLNDIENARHLNPARFNFLQGMTESNYINDLRDGTAKSSFKSNDELFHFTQGFSYLKNNDFFAASVYFGEAIRRNDAKTLAASLYLQAKAFHCAKNEPGLVSRYSLIKPFYVNIIENLSNALTLEPHFKEAADFLNAYLFFQVTEYDLSRIEAEKLFSAIKLLSKEQQIDLLQNILSKANNKGETGLLRSFAHKHGLIEKMHAHLIQLDPDNYKNYYNGAKLTDKELFAVGNIFYKQGRFKASEAIYAAIKSNQFDVAYKRGAAYLKQAQMDAVSYQDVEQNITMALTHFADSKSAKAYCKSAFARLLLGDKKLVDKKLIDQALADCNKAIARKPKYAEAYNMCGLVYYTKGKIDKAIEDYKRAIKCYPNFADAHLQLALAYEAKNDKVKAIEHYIKAMQIDKNYQKACSRSEHVSKKQKLKPLISSTDKNFAPHLAEVSQALTDPADKLAALFLNMEAGELDALKDEKLISFISELPAEKHLAIIDKCFLDTSSALGKRFSKWDIKQKLIHERAQLQLKVIHSPLSEVLTHAQMAVVPTVQSTVMDYPEILSPVYEQQPVPVYQAVYEHAQRPAASVAIPQDNTHQPTVLFPVYNPITKQKVEANIEPIPLYPQLTEMPKTFPVVPVPVFTQNTAASFQPPSVPAAEQASKRVAATPESSDKSLTYQQQKLKANETLHRYFQESDPVTPYQHQKLKANEKLYRYLQKSDQSDPNEKMRDFLEVMQENIRVREREKKWTIKSIFGEERPGLPSHIKEIKRLLLKNQNALLYGSGIEWLFNKVLDVFTNLKDSKYRTDFVKDFDAEKLRKGKEIKELHAQTLLEKNNQKQEGTSVVEPPPYKPIALEPVYIKTNAKLTNDLNELPSVPTHAPVVFPAVPKHKPTFFTRVKEALGIANGGEAVILKR